MNYTLRAAAPVGITLLTASMTPTTAIITQLLIEIGQHTIVAPPRRQDEDYTAPLNTAPPRRRRRLAKIWGVVVLLLLYLRLNTTMRAPPNYFSR